MLDATVASTETILVVDDNPTNIQVLFDVLSEIGYRVAIAKSGESALQRLQSFQPDIILLDVMMPGIDGFETCKRLKADSATRAIPVIFMTALSDSVDKVKGLSLGAVDYITKPIQHEEALARIRVHLQLRDSQKKLEYQTTKLSQTLDNLKQAQVHLVQSEKMSSLGQLVAGVAHEINNQAFQGTDMLLQTLQKVKAKPNRNLKIAGFVPTMYDSRNSHDELTLKAIQEQLAPIGKIFPFIPKSTVFADASMERMPLAVYSPRHPAKKVLEGLAKEMEKLG